MASTPCPTFQFVRYSIALGPTLVLGRHIHFRQEQRPCHLCAQYFCTSHYFPQVNRHFPTKIHCPQRSWCVLMDVWYLNQNSMVPWSTWKTFVFVVIMHPKKPKSSGRFFVEEAVQVCLPESPNMHWKCKKTGCRLWKPPGTGAGAAEAGGQQGNVITCVHIPSGLAMGLNRSHSSYLRLTLCKRFIVMLFTRIYVYMRVPQPFQERKDIIKREVCAGWGNWGLP